MYSDGMKRKTATTKDPSCNERKIHLDTLVILVVMSRNVCMLAMPRHAKIGPFLIIAGYS